jgi:hypothetical protein
VQAGAVVDHMGLVLGLQMVQLEVLVVVEV